MVNCKGARSPQHKDQPQPQGQDEGQRQPRRRAAAGGDWAQQLAAWLGLVEEQPQDDLLQPLFG